MRVETDCTRFSDLYTILMVWANFAFRAALVFGWVGESDPPSRRMVNLSYMAWVWGGNLAVIAAFKLTDRVLPAPARAPGASGSMVTAVSGNQ